MPTLSLLQPTHPTVRNAGEGNGLEAWRRLHSEYDSTSSMRRVAILQQVQNPPRCQRVEDLGYALISKKLQYEMAYRSTKQSVKMCESRRQTRTDDPMDVDALSKGKSKGKAKKGHGGSGKSNKVQNQMIDVEYWNCGRTGHFASDCRDSWLGERERESGKSRKEQRQKQGQRQR